MPKTFFTTDNEEQGSSKTTASGGLTIPKQLFARLIEAVRTKLVLRQLVAITVPPAQIPGSSVDIDLVKEGEGAMDVIEIAEGAELPHGVIEFETFNLKPKKYAVRIPITSEMLEDGKWNLLQHGIDTAGYKMAKKIDSTLATQLNQQTTNSVSGGATISIANITRAMRYLEENDYAPTDFIVGTNVADDTRNIDTFVEADKARVTDPSQSLIGRIFGMNVWVCRTITNTSAFIIDRSHALIFAEKRPITIKNFDDFVRDGRQASVTSRWAARYLRLNAIARITTT